MDFDPWRLPAVLAVALPLVPIMDPDILHDLHRFPIVRHKEPVPIQPRGAPISAMVMAEVPVLGEGLAADGAEAGILLAVLFPPQPPGGTQFVTVLPVAVVGDLDAGRLVAIGPPVSVFTFGHEYFPAHRTGPRFHRLGYGVPVAPFVSTLALAFIGRAGKGMV